MKEYLLLAVGMFPTDEVRLDLVDGFLDRFGHSSFLRPRRAPESPPLGPCDRGTRCGRVISPSCFDAIHQALAAQKGSRRPGIRPRSRRSSHGGQPLGVKGPRARLNKRSSRCAGTSFFRFRCFLRLFGTCKPFRVRLRRSSHREPPVPMDVGQFERDSSC